jgi:hypothetical protein
MSVLTRERPVAASSPARLTDLKSNQCRWPVDAAGRCDCAPSGPFGHAREQLFCAAVTAPGKAYCEGHMARASGRGTKAEREAIRFARNQARREFRVQSGEAT